MYVGAASVSLSIFERKLFITIADSSGCHVLEVILGQPSLGLDIAIGTTVGQQSLTETWRAEYALPIMEIRHA